MVKKGSPSEERIKSGDGKRDDLISKGVLLPATSRKQFGSRGIVSFRGSNQHQIRNKTTHTDRLSILQRIHCRKHFVFNHPIHHNQDLVAPLSRLMMWQPSGSRPTFEKPNGGGDAMAREKLDGNESSGRTGTEKAE